MSAAGRAWLDDDAPATPVARMARAMPAPRGTPPPGVPAHALAPAVSSRWRSAHEVLLVRLDNLGDLLMTTPAIAAVRECLPAARITLLTSPAGAALSPHLPDIDEVIAFEAPWVRPPGSAAEERAQRQREAELAATLAARRFDAAIVFTVCTQSALPAAMLCRQAGVPLALAHCRENPYRLLSDWVREPDVTLETARHEVRRQLDLVRSVGLTTPDERLRFRLLPADAVTLRRKLTAAGLGPHEDYLVVHPGATAASRRYPLARFVEAAAEISVHQSCRIVLAGGPAEAADIAQAGARLGGRAVALAGVLSLGELAALIAGAAVTLCNNSGPSHLAAALEAPVVVPYALTNPQHTPWGGRSRVLSHDVACRNCLRSVCPEQHHACLLGVPAQALVRAALELLRPLDDAPVAAALSWPDLPAWLDPGAPGAVPGGDGAVPTPHP